ncbi:MAG TPA: hypothetical protein VF970_03205 [Gemmatimonadales bacterium]
MCVVGLRRGARIRPAAWRGVLGVPGLAAAWLSAAGCGERAVTTVHLQGTVRTLGLQMPVTGAEVTVQWPAALGGGESALRTNSAGQYVVERRVRQREVSCAGLAVSVQAPTFATAYNRYAESSCGDGVLTFDFTLYPIPH